jgi:galactokinase
VLGENGRTLEAASAMRRGAAEELGRLMAGSHASLRDDFEVSSPALNAIVDCANSHPACFGARMTGAGFGGCAVALVQEEAASGFGDAVAACYREATGLEAKLYVVEAANGAELLT